MTASAIHPQSMAVLDSVTQASAADRDSVVVCGSHGGVYAARYAAAAGFRAAIFNDAGLGKDNAGIAGLAFLDALAIPACTVSCRTSRIGDGRDTLARGVVSHVNRAAGELGCAPGDTCAAAAAKLVAAPAFRATVPALAESRAQLHRDSSGRAVICLDSGSLVSPQDAGHILIIGSHGGLLGGRAQSALGVAAAAAVFHDAGIGIDNAGVGRLLPLDTRGIAAATVDGSTARIGDGRSIHATGVLSRHNDTALRMGARIGQPVGEFVDAMLTALRIAPAALPPLAPSDVAPGGLTPHGSTSH